MVKNKSTEFEETDRQFHVNVIALQEEVTSRTDTSGHNYMYATMDL